MLYTLNQGYTPKGEAIDEQLEALGVKSSELDYVVLTHLDCDHACGLHHIPGHCEGLVCVKITGKAGKFVLLTSDGAYSEKNWKDLVLPGIHANRSKQLKSLEWIRESGMDPNCIEILSTYDPDVKPHIVELDL